MISDDSRSADAGAIIGKKSPSTSGATSKSSSPPSGSKKLNDDLGTLPDGWEQRIVKYVYYVNHATRTTQWEYPRQIQDPRGIYKKK